MNSIIQLKSILKEKRIDYLILPNNDQFQSEYLPENEKRLEFLTQFTGSSAVIVICAESKNAFFTDGRYTLQAQKELNKKEFDIFDLSQKSLIKWLVENIKKDEIVAIDGSLHSKKQANSIEGHVIGKKANFISLASNPVDEIWQNRMKVKEKELFLFEEKYSGQETGQKISNLLEKLQSDSDAILLNFPASINWLLNIRGNDVEYTPLCLCYALIKKDSTIDLFLDQNISEEFFDKELEEYFLKHHIKIFIIKDIKKRLKLIKSDFKNIQIDSNYLDFSTYQILQSEKFSIIEKNDPILELKAIKNEIEIKNNIIAHEKDGLALTKFLFWLEGNQKIDELTAANKLLEFRQRDKDFIYPSFNTISSFGANGSIIHYSASEKTNKKFTENNLYLVDSGGQYKFGTTDVTRTILVGNAKKEHIDNFTRVLKGNLAIARCKFPIGTRGSDLDVLARFHLWQNFQDYAHGTGHGVGQFLSVHESPPSISRNQSAILKEGMILSNEPGYYKDNEYGIRIENLMLVEKSKNKNFLQFKTLTLAPIDPRLVNFKMITYPEKKWLINYHQEIYTKLEKNLDSNEIEWLKKIVSCY